jgi:hypothetical protein
VLSCNTVRGNFFTSILCFASFLIVLLQFGGGGVSNFGGRGCLILGEGVIVTPRPHLTPGKDPVPIVEEAGWAPGPVWIGAENLAPTGIRSPSLPALSESLYPLSYADSRFKLCGP